MSSIPQSNTQTNSRITNSQQLPRNSCNGLKILPWKNTTPHYPIDHCTQLSASIVVSNKNPDIIIQAIFKIWISVYSSTEKFLTDNSREFRKDDFIQLCERFATESPWNNGSVELQNFILSDMLDKVLHESNCYFDLALAWTIHAKNSLSNIHGSSPYELSIGTNRKLPSLHLSEAPVITSTLTNKTIIKKLEGLHQAIATFIASENSEKVRRALT